MADPGFANEGPRSSAQGAEGVGLKRGCPPPQRGRSLGTGHCPLPKKCFDFESEKMATFSAFWALFLQFIVHSSMDCLKRFRRQNPLLVGKLAVVCMQIALGGKTSVLETTL